MYTYRERSSSGLVMGLVLMLPLLVISATRLLAFISYDRECGGYLKRAADANTVDIAKQELQRTLRYIEGHDMTQGYTSVVYETPDEDVGFWYRNLKASMTELNAVRPDASALERSNVLMKLRETLLDHGSNGDKVTAPKGISAYPYNGVYFIGFLLSTIAALVGAVNLMRR